MFNFQWIFFITHYSATACSGDLKNMCSLNHADLQMLTHFITYILTSPLVSSEKPLRLESHQAHDDTYIFQNLIFA